MSNCLKDQDLTLLYYGDLPDGSSQARHITDCSLCREKLDQLRSDLESLPQLNYSEHSAVATRVCARVSEQLLRPRRRWIPIVGTLAVSTCALVATFMVSTPQQEKLLPSKLMTTTQVSITLDDAMPDIDFLEDMELLMELELLSQVEGV